MSRRFVVPFLSLLLCASASAGHRFSASATAVSGEHRTAVASVALPPSGGDAANVVRDYDDGLVRFAEATTAVHGAREGDVAFTSTSTEIRDVWIAGRIHVDRLVVRTNARQHVEDAEASIDFEGSLIEGLSIDGKGVEVGLDTQFFAKHPTFASLGGGADFMNCSAYAVATCHGGLRGIRIPDLGFLSIGDVFIKNGARSISMLRLHPMPRSRRVRTNDDPPPPDPGPVTIGDSGSNGVPIWP
ncbi:MAG TPA: hypothetical protein VNI54_04115 [Thermoanaerobaculia bacterium]|nr:hypothetical protein [Thermoanaerobaculia bacterium]